jgi:hypothetical protein
LRLEESEDMMKCRKALAEHPFGTLKCRAGYRHFLMRGLNKVRGELSLMVLCYNFTRALTIVGLDGLIRWLATRSFLPAIWPLAVVFTALQTLHGRSFWKTFKFSTVATPPWALFHTRMSFAGQAA